jgi:hypothetical protein
MPTVPDAAAARVLRDVLVAHDVTCHSVGAAPDPGDASAMSEPPYPRSPRSAWRTCSHLRSQAGAVVTPWAVYPL